MEVLIPNPRGSQHLAIWSVSACRAMLHPLWWQHQFWLVFWPHAFTSTQQCSIIQIMCRCKYDKANTNTCHIMWLCQSGAFQGLSSLPYCHPHLATYKESHVLHKSVTNGSILINIHELLTLILLLISKRLLSEIPPTRKKIRITCGTCM